MRIIIVVCMGIFLSSCAMTSIKTEKINGVSFVASRDSISQKHVDPIIKLNANYASIMPFGFIRDLEHPEIVFNNDRQWFGETEIGSKQYIKALKLKGIKIMMKPQIWVRGGEFTGLIKMKTEEEWLQLEKTYLDFIMEYAKVAEETDTEIFCIGTELENFVAKRPEFWNQLIVKIREIYNGKLTYAANWNEYSKTPFWSELDFIGIDAYFPLSELQTPTLQDCKEGWLNHKTEIKSYSEQFNKPILFTEYGYRSVDFSAKAPWKSDMEMDKVNMEAQNNTTEALFDEFWNEDWFAGGFIWKWFHNHERAGGKNDTQFTPQNKPVEEIVRKYYGLY